MTWKTHNKFVFTRLNMEQRWLYAIIPPRPLSSHRIYQSAVITIFVHFLLSALQNSKMLVIYLTIFDHWKCKRTKSVRIGCLRRVCVGNWSVVKSAFVWNNGITVILATYRVLCLCVSETHDDHDDDDDDDDGGVQRQQQQEHQYHQWLYANKHVNNVWREKKGIKKGMVMGTPNERNVVYIDCALKNRKKPKPQPRTKRRKHLTLNVRWLSGWLVRCLHFVFRLWAARCVGVCFCSKTVNIVNVCGAYL